MDLTTLRDALKPPCAVLDVHVHPLGPRAPSVQADALRVPEAARLLPDWAGVKPL